MRKLLLALALAGGLCSPALAQSVGYTDLTGNECWNAGEGIGGPSQWLCSDVLRNSNQIVISPSITAAITIGVSTGTTALRYGGNLMTVLQPLAAVITMPPNPVPDGAIIGICNGTNAAYATNVVTVAANTGQTMVPTGAAITLTTLAAATCVRYQFNRPTTSWYKVQ